MEECHSEYPLVLAKVNVEDVGRFWADQPFDLAITSDQGNCTLCFLKGKAKLIRLIRAQPQLADWWMDMESQSDRWPGRKPLRQPRQARFSKRFSIAELREEALNPRQMELLDDEPEVDCFCGD